jgi:hypothetical protein
MGLGQAVLLAPVARGFEGGGQRRVAERALRLWNGVLLAPVFMRPRRHVGRSVGGLLGRRALRPRLGGALVFAAAGERQANPEAQYE